MPRYIAFLRAVNVGGRVVKMEELKKLFAIQGVKNISTYIQSGNVVFDGAEGNPDIVKKKLEARLLKALGYEVTVFLKTFDEVRDIIKRNPFRKDLEDKGLYISMLSAIPEAEGLKLLQLLVAEHEEVIISGTEAYILVVKNGYGNSKLSNTAVEKKLKVRATTRNWATMNKILVLE